MCKMHFRVTAEIQPAFDTIPTDGPFRFTVLDSTFIGPLEIVVNETGTEICSSVQAAISHELHESLVSDISRCDLEQRLAEELSSHTTRLSAKNKSVLRLLQQELHKYQPHELFNGRMFWSNDGAEWHPILGGTLSGAIRAEPCFRLDVEWKQHIQWLLDRNEQPLLASQHLHEAERAHGKRFSWIEATIAAELAIKEVLVRLEPKFKVLLLEVPSPPLRKLYGEILQAVAGEKSPHQSAIHQDSEQRNRLIHRPEQYNIEPQEVSDYLQSVRSAIQHLLTLDRRRSTFRDDDAGTQSVARSVITEEQITS